MRLSEARTIVERALRLTYTAHGAILSDADGYVTHRLLRPGLTGGWKVYEVTAPHTRRYLGRFESPEAALAALSK